MVEMLALVSGSVVFFNVGKKSKFSFAVWTCPQVATVVGALHSLKRTEVVVMMETRRRTTFAAVMSALI